MDRVADHDQHAAAAVIVRARVRVVHLAVLGVAVPPEQQLFQHEKREDADQDREARLPRRFLERVGNHLEERRAEQRTDGVRDEHRNPRRAQRQRERGERGGERAADKACEEDPP